MAVGISTACFYPSETEASLLSAAELGTKVTEIFFNSPSELEKDFIDKLLKIKNDYSLQVKSIHPFASFAETYNYFSSYKRRFYDGVETIKQYAEAMNTLGAEILVMHGVKDPCAISEEECFDRFAVLCETGKQHGIKIAQENVFNYYSGNIDYLERMKKHLGANFSLVLDVKQAHKSGYSAFDFTDKFAKDIVHLHLSDFNAVSDCIPPLEGSFDFDRLFSYMKQANYKGDYVIELYQNSYHDAKQLICARDGLEKILNR